MAELSNQERVEKFQKIIDSLLPKQWKNYMRFLGISENELHNQLEENDQHQMLKNRQENLGTLTPELVNILEDVVKEVTDKERKPNVDLMFRTKQKLKLNRNRAWMLYDFIYFYTGDNWNDIAINKLLVQPDMFRIKNECKKDDMEQKFQMVLVWIQRLDLEDDENCHKLDKAFKDLDVPYSPTVYIGDDSIDTALGRVVIQPSNGSANEADSSTNSITQPEAGEILGEKQDKASELTEIIMISYCWKNKAEVKIARELEADLKKEGYKTWIDVNDMQGSTKQCAYDAVKSCDIFLPCISQKYFESGPCEEEAKLAKELKKRIIPIRVENGFRATGWLKMVITDALYYDFFYGKNLFDKLVKDISIVPMKTNASSERQFYRCILY